MNMQPIQLECAVCGDAFTAHYDTDAYDRDRQATMDALPRICPPSRGVAHRCALEPNATESPNLLEWIVKVARKAAKDAAQRELEDHVSHYDHESADLS